MELNPINPILYNLDYVESDGDITLYYSVVYIGNIKVENIDRYINYLKQNEIDTTQIRFYKSKK